MATEKLTTRLKNSTWTNPQIKTIKRTMTQTKDPTHTHILSS